MEHFAFVAEHTVNGGIYGFGLDLLACRDDVRRQLRGALPGMRASVWTKLRLRSVTDDEASEILEMLDADVIAWVS